MKVKTQNKYKRYIILIFVLGFLFFKDTSFADGISGQCSKDGYTITTINGILTNDEGAKENIKKLKETLGLDFNGQKIDYQYLLNPSHLGGVRDLSDVIAQGNFNEKSNYDLANILIDASKKIKTQKVLVVGHSEGNFYANNFYDEVTSEIFGIPNESIGVYGIATPASRVAGVAGKPDITNYITSSTDNIINYIAPVVLQNILPYNTNISEVANQSGLFAGHDFREVYLTYRPVEIVSGIQSSLKKLQTNNIQNINEICMGALPLTFAQNMQGIVFAVADPTASFLKTVSIGSYHIASAIGNGIINVTTAIASGISSFAQSIFNNTKGLATNNTASVINATDDTNSVIAEAESVSQNSTADSASSSALPKPETTNLKTTEALLPQLPQKSPVPENVSVENSIPVPKAEATPPPQLPIQVTQLTPIILPAPQNTQSNFVTGTGGGEISLPTPDTTAPVISMIGDSSIEIIKNTSYTDDGATALDDKDGDLTSAIVKSGTFTNTATIGTYDIVYTATDIAGNISVSTRTINVVAPPDTTSPVISVTGTNPMTINVGDVFTDAGATALDDVDGVVTVSPSGTVNNWMVGTYTITYTAIDNATNTATTTRTVNVTDVISGMTSSSSDLNNNGTTDSEENDVVVDSDMSLPAGEYHFNNLTITNNATLTLQGDPLSTNSFKGVKINAVNITIDAGSSISADYKGYGPNQGPGAGEDSGVSNPGASYGGISLRGLATSTYGSARKPVDLGSGGAWLYHGGGAMRFVVSDTFTNNGIVSANGNPSCSGGSIYVTTKNLTGNGTFRANGGNLFDSGFFKSPGGGGRVALYYQTSSFSGTAEAKGGYGSYDSWITYYAQDGTAGIFDVVNNDLYLNNSWEFQQSDSPFIFNNIYISNSAQVTSKDGVNITANNVFLDKASTLNLSGEEIINISTLSLLGNSNIIIAPEKILSLVVSNLNIETGSTISADDKGYLVGPGTPDPFFEAGASYGGKGGGLIAKPTYGDATAPVDFGSGTEGRYGGGAIRLVVNNTFQNDGIVSANGNRDRVSGGSIYVTAKNIIGSGTFQANGGNSSWPYGPIGGAGGRIAIHYQTSSFSGTTSVLGGTYCFYGCAPAAENGTVEMIDESISPL